MYKKSKEAMRLGKKLYLPRKNCCQTEHIYSAPPFFETHIYINLLLPYFIFVFFHDGEQDKVMAYVSVDINPSVEASVDSNLRVLRLEAYNAEGKQILKRAYKLAKATAI
ncbi:hypothetical protein GCM10020331_062910 [Ectobacillus funiculus]